MGMLGAPYPGGGSDWSPLQPYGNPSAPHHYGKLVTMTITVGYKNFAFSVMLTGHKESDKMAIYEKILELTEQAFYEMDKPEPPTGGWVMSTGTT